MILSDGCNGGNVRRNFAIIELAPEFALRAGLCTLMLDSEAMYCERKRPCLPVILLGDSPLPREAAQGKPDQTTC